MSAFEAGHFVILLITVFVANIMGGGREQRSAGVMVLYFAVAWWAQRHTGHPVGILTACFAMLAWGFYRLSVTGFGDMIAAIFAILCIAGGLAIMGVVGIDRDQGSFAVTFWAIKGWGIALANVLIIASAVSLRGDAHG